MTNINALYWTKIDILFLFGGFLFWAGFWTLDFLDPMLCVFLFVFCVSC